MKCLLSFEINIGHVSNRGFVEDSSKLGFHRSGDVGENDSDRQGGSQHHSRDVGDLSSETSYNVSGQKEYDRTCAGSFGYFVGPRIGRRGCTRWRRGQLAHYPP